MNNYKILTVEDDLSQSKLLEKVIAKIEVESVSILYNHAPNYDVAVEIIQNNYPDLILLDVVLPGLSGLYVSAFITAYAINHDLPQPKIFFLTGIQDNKDNIINKANLLGASFLWKPYDIKVLQEMIKKCIIDRFQLDQTTEVVESVPKEDSLTIELSKENVELFRNLEHYVAHLIMELQFFRTKSREMRLGNEEEQFLDEMAEIESKTMVTFEKIKKDFLLKMLK